MPNPDPILDWLLDPGQPAPCHAPRARTGRRSEQARHARRPAGSPPLQRGVPRG